LWEKRTDAPDDFCLASNGPQPFPTSTHRRSTFGQHFFWDITRSDERRQDGKTVEMMGRFVEIKEKYAEAEEREKTNANEDDFPIPPSTTIVDGKEEFFDDGKVDAYNVFKDIPNRAIFMTAKDAMRIK
jgi:hypothetical protein